MANDKVRKAVENISVRRGGNIFTKKELITQDAKSVFVFIGLGGLGCRAVNEIKSVTEDNMTDNDRRFFAAIDTDKTAMDKLARISLNDTGDDDEPVRRGRLDSDEMIEIYDPAHPFALKDADENMKKWLRADRFTGVRIDDQGAQQVRQVGRVMLFANNNYVRVKSELSAILSAAYDKMNHSEATKVYVYIMAGISGGTGSGTVIDISYMVRNIISGLDANSFYVEGCLFTPDVQMKDNNIDGHQDIQNALKRNFYAAIKEVDYFYNNLERDKAYVCPQPGEPERPENIFDDCRLVSRRDTTGAAVCANSKEVVQKFAQAVMYEIANVENAAEDNFSYRSNQSNVANIVNSWRTTGVAQGMNLPDWAPPRYSAFGYGSFYIPKNEIFAYCANKLIEEMRELWEQQNISEAGLKQEVRKAHLTDGRTFAAHLFEIAGCEQSFQLGKNLMPHDPVGPGPVWNVDRYIQELDAIVMQTTAKVAINRYMNAARGANDITLIKEFTAPIISTVSKAFTDPAKGPAYAINLLSAGISIPDIFTYYDEGILRKLRRIIKEVASEAETWKTELKVTRAQLLDDAEKLKKFALGQHEEGDIANFQSGYLGYAKSRLMAELLGNSKEYLERIYEILNAENHRLFEIFSTTVEYLCSVLKGDSEYITDTERKREGNITTFTFDVTNFAEDDPVSQRIFRFFDGLISQKTVAVESKTFIKNVFEKLQDELDKPNAEVTEELVETVLHDYFKGTFSDWVSDTVEKFCYIAYSNNDVTPDQVADIFADPDKRALAFQNVASDIRIKLAGKTKILLTSADNTRNVENFSNYTAIGMIAETKDINDAIPEASKVTLSAGWSEFIMYKKIYGLPLFLVDELKEYKELYDAGASVGMHLDEVGEDAWQNFPEPYGYPSACCLRQYVDEGEDVTEKDKKLLKRILDEAILAKQYGLLEEKSVAVTIDENVTNNDEYYALIYKLIDAGNESEEEIYNKLSVAYGEAENPDDFMDVMKKAGYRIANPIELNWGTVHPRYDIITGRREFGDSQNFGNFIKIVYSNVQWRAYLKQGIETFGRYYAVYQKVMEDAAVSDVYNRKIKDLYQAIRFGAVTMPDDKTFAIHYGEKADQVLTAQLRNSWEQIDKEFLMYHFFTEVVLTMDDELYSDFKSYLRMLMDKDVLADSKNILKHINDVIANSDYLGETTKSSQLKTFKSELEFSGKQYNVPNPCGSMKSNEEIGVVIDNLSGFYKKLRDQLERN